MSLLLHSLGPGTCLHEAGLQCGQRDEDGLLEEGGKCSVRRSCAPRIPVAFLMNQPGHAGQAQTIQFCGVPHSVVLRSYPWLCFLVTPGGA